MRTSEVDILFVAGAPIAVDAEHWQARWQGRLSTARQVEPADRRRLESWVAAVQAAVSAATRPLVLVAHGLGVLVVVKAAPGFPPDRVKGAFLVAPPTGAWLEAARDIDPGFRQTSTEPLPFPSVLVASRNGSTSDFAQTEELSYDWGAAFVDAGEAGRLDAQSGHGPWPEGLMRFASFMAKL